MLKKDKPVLYDSLIISRVKQYLEDNVHQTYVDVAVMAQDLQDKYKEYTKRKTGAFRLLVEQAYKTVLHSYGLDSNPSSEEDPDVTSDLEFMDDNPQKQVASMNDALQSLYMNKGGNKRAPPPATATVGDDLINISSDESGDEGGGNSVVKKPAALANVTPEIIVTKIQKTGEKVPVAKTIETEVSAPPQAKKRRVDPPATSPKSDARSDAKISASTPQVDNTRKEQKTASQTAEPLQEAPDSAAQSLKARKGRKEPGVQTSTLTFKNFGGNKEILKELWEILMFYKHSKSGQSIGLTPTRGLLLHGPPGSGKTLLAHVIAGQAEIPIMEVAAPEFVTGISGDSEAKIRRIFDQVTALAPCILFIDEFDVISSQRANAQKDMERRIVAQLMICLDNLNNVPNGDKVLVIAATSRMETIDPGLRRGGRLDREIGLGIPGREDRADILRVICEKMPLSRPFDFDALAALTPGFVGVDLVTLAQSAIQKAFLKVILAKDGAAFLEKCEEQKRKKTTEEEPDDAVVNLTDDGLLMDVDVTSSTKEEDKLPETPAQIVIDDEEPVSVKEVTKEITKEPEAQEEIKQNGTVDSVESTHQEKDDAMEVSCESTPPVSVDTAADVPKPENHSIVEEEKKPAEENNKEEVRSEEKKAEEEKVEEKKEDEVTLVTESESPTIDITESPVKKAPPPLRPENCKSPETTSKDEIPQILIDIKSHLQLSDMLELLSRESTITSDDLADFTVTMEDFKEALETTQPMAKREGFVTVPDVTWNDIGSLSDIREELELVVTASVKYPKKLKALKYQNFEPSSGVLLCGPPGCGKTLVAKAVANEAGINFISVKGPELLNMYVGESERAVRQCFQRARYAAPCVIFFDEFDALCPKRSSRTENTGASRVVNQLLTEMDGIQDRKGVFVLAATNRPDMIDSAVLRPGRFDKVLFVGIPGLSDRRDILKALTKNGTEPPIADHVDFTDLAILTEGFTGADLAGLIRQAIVKAFKESIAQNPEDSDDIKVTKDHFMQALHDIKPSVSEEERENYEKLRMLYSSNSGSAERCLP